jgi:hypothetical protein
MISSLNLVSLKVLPRAAVGFVLQVFSHTFTPLLPLASSYRDRRMPLKGSFTSASSLIVELFLKYIGNRDFSFLRIVCQEYKFLLWSWLIVVTLYSQIRLSSVRMIRWGYPDELTVSFLFEGRSCGFTSEHGFMLTGLGSSMWFSDLVNHNGSDVYFADTTPTTTTMVSASQWNRFDLVFLRASHAYVFYQLLDEFIPRNKPGLGIIPSCVLDAFQVERLVFPAPVSSSGSDESSDQAPVHGVLPVVTEMSVQDVALIDPSQYDDLPVRYIQISRDFTGSPYLVEDDNPETVPLELNPYRLRRPRTPVFGSLDSFWCAMYLRRTEGGPRAQVMGLQVDPERHGFDYFETDYFLRDGSAFQGEDLGEDSLIMRLVGPPLYRSDSETVCETDVEV